MVKAATIATTPDEQPGRSRVLVSLLVVLVVYTGLAMGALWVAWDVQHLRSELTARVHQLGELHRALSALAEGDVSAARAQLSAGSPDLAHLTNLPVERLSPAIEEAMSEARAANASTSALLAQRFDVLLGVDLAAVFLGAGLLIVVYRLRSVTATADSLQRRLVAQLEEQRATSAALRTQRVAREDALRAEALASASAEAAARSELELRAVIQRIPDGVAILREGRIAWSNAALARMTGWDTLYGAPWPLPTAEPSPDVRIQTLRVRNEIRQIEVSAAAPIHFEGDAAEVVVARDLTERLRTEAWVRSADRMALLGTTAAGMAHELNNPLTWLLGALDRARRHPASADPELSGYLERAYAGAERVRRYSEALRSFANSRTSEPEAVDVEEVIRTALPLVSYVAESKATVTTSAFPGTYALAHPSWLSQVLLNLLVHGAHSIPAGSARSHFLSVECDTDGEKVAIRVHHNGTPIPLERQAAIFEPGTPEAGLGLYACHELCGRMNAELELEQSDAHRTTFVLRLPAHRAAGRPVGATEAEEGAPGAGRVLVVDDEVELASLIATFLGDHEVRTAATLAQARAGVVEFQPDAIVCDLMLPDGSGAGLYAWLLASNPALAERMIFITGGSMLPEIGNFLDSVPNPRFLKPFDFGKLAREVARVLPRAAEPPAPPAELPRGDAPLAREE